MLSNFVLHLYKNIFNIFGFVVICFDLFIWFICIDLFVLLYFQLKEKIALLETKLRSVFPPSSALCPHSFPSRLIDWLQPCQTTLSSAKCDSPWKALGPDLGLPQVSPSITVLAQAHPTTGSSSNERKKYFPFHSLCTGNHPQSVFPLWFCLCVWFFFFWSKESGNDWECLKK